MTDVFFDIGFFYSLRPDFSLGVWYVQTIHFGPETHKFSRRQQPRFAFKFS